MSRRGRSERSPEGPESRSDTGGVTIRAARASDGGALGRMGGALARQHHAFDPQRFMLPDDVEAGYAWWLTKELGNKRAVVLVAEIDGKVCGYVYGRMEARDWNALRDKCGGFHDVWVDDSARRRGVASKLCEALIAAFASLGAPRIVLMSASKNAGAQALFRKLGFRDTMIEMTRELDDR